MKIAIAAAALAAMTGAALAQDGLANYLGRPAGIGGDGFRGGVFNMRAVTNIAGTNLQAGDVFQSFCVELDELITSGDVNVRYRADGLTVQGSGANGEDTDGNGGNGGDQIKDQTAYLFRNFALGNYVGADGSIVAVSRGLQLAIWYFEEFLSPGDDPVATFLELDNWDPDSDGGAALAQAAIFIAAADAAVLGGFTRAGSGVGVLNLGEEGTWGNQDMLIFVPLPQAGALAGLGLLGMAVRRRRAGV